MRGRGGHGNFGGRGRGGRGGRGRGGGRGGFKRDQDEEGFGEKRERKGVLAEEMMSYYRQVSATLEQGFDDDNPEVKSK